jgi:hypothetical protein
VIRFIEYEPVQNVAVRKVEKVGGRSELIHTFPNVSQFWNYKPEDFLATGTWNNPRARTAVGGELQGQISGQADDFVLT